MDDKHLDELEAHLVRYGIPMPEECASGIPRIEVGRRMEQITRRLNETEQEALFWQASRYAGHRGR